MDAPIRRPAPLLLAPLKSVLAVAVNPHDLICGLGGLLGTLADSGLQVRLACWPPLGNFEDLQATAEELAADEFVTIPRAAAQGAVGLEDGIARLIADSDAVLVVGASREGADESRRRLIAAASTAAARKGRLLLEWLGQHDPAARLRHLPPGGARSDLFTLRVDRSRQRRMAARLREPPGCWLEAPSAATGYDRVRARHAPYGPRLTRLRERLGPLLRPDAAPGERREALHVLAAFASGGDWPDELLRPDPGGEPASHDLCQEPRWTLASVVFRAGQATPPHRHESWGAAATIVGVERNLRYAGRPELPRFVDEQIAPVGGGYLFESELCHQAMDGSGDLTVSLHLLVHPRAGDTPAPVGMGNGRSKPG